MPGSDADEDEAEDAWSLDESILKFISSAIGVDLVQAVDTFVSVAIAPFAGIGALSVAKLNVTMPHIPGVDILIDGVPIPGVKSVTVRGVDGIPIIVDSNTADLLNAQAKVEAWVVAHAACHTSMYGGGGSAALTAAAFQTAWQLAAIVAVSNVVCGKMLSFMMAPISAAAIIAFAPVVMVRAYDISPVCILRVPPLLPANLADDLFDILNTTIIPRHLPWPDGLSPDSWARTPVLPGSPRLRAMSPPIACTAPPIGMTDGLHALVWALELYVPGWRSYAPLYTFQLLTSVDLMNDYFFKYVDLPVDSDAYRACAIMVLPNVLLTLTILGVAAILLLSVWHLILFFTKEFLKVVAAVTSA